MVEPVVVFEEAQRAWDARQLASFMKRKTGLPGFTQTETNCFFRRWTGASNRTSSEPKRHSRLPRIAELLNPVGLPCFGVVLESDTDFFGCRIHNRRAMA